MKKENSKIKKTIKVVQNKWWKWYQNNTLSVLLPKILNSLEEWKNIELLNEEKWIIITKLIDLLRISIKTLFKTNLKTLSNKKFIENILKEKFVEAKDVYYIKNEEMLKKIWWKENYNKYLVELNSIFKLLDEKIDKNKTWWYTFCWSNKKNYEKLLKNKLLRWRYIKTIDIWKEIFKNWKWISNTDELQEIYEFAIIPILNFLIKEEVIEYKKAKEFEKLIKDLIKNWISKTNNWKLLMNSKIRVSYWPIQNVYYNTKKTEKWIHVSKWNNTYFWSKWTIWYRIEEEIWNKKQVITWWSEYFSLLQQWLSYLKNQWKNVNFPKKVLLYILLKQEFQNVHLNILNQLNILMEDVKQTFKVNWLNQKETEKIIKIWNSIIVFKKQIEKSTDEIQKNTIFLNVKKW